MYWLIIYLGLGAIFALSQYRSFDKSAKKVSRQHKGNLGTKTYYRIGMAFNMVFFAITFPFWLMLFAILKILKGFSK